MTTLTKKEHYLYSTYARMKQRCYDPGDPGYPYYGGRGITVCQRWLDDFWNFVEDMGERPEGFTLTVKILTVITVPKTVVGQI